MCGICGVVTRDANHPDRNPARIVRMRDAMPHRGPDDTGLYCAAHVGLGQRRLSIIDLSGGAQPMPSDDERLWVLSNGEIYNYQTLFARLQQRGHRFRTQSDTEAIVYAYREWGVDCVQHLRGMFAIAVWDEARRRLFLARDRAGQKPLYYAQTPDGLHFASELKALVVDNALPREINRQALADYLTYISIPAPLTIFEGIYKLPPAHALTYDIDSGELQTWRYWQWNRLTAPPTSLTYPEAVEALRRELGEAVRLRMIADVPLGALLSGGVDSSAVVAMMARHSSRPVKTFTIGFSVASHDERDAARAVAQHYGTEHYEQVLEPESVESVAETLACQYDEPFADSSMLPTYYVCKMARQWVTVALAGDGGDEVFAGYRRYARMVQIERLVRLVPLGLRRVSAPILQRMPGWHLQQVAKHLRLDGPGRYQRKHTQFTPEEQAALLHPGWVAQPRALVAGYMRAANGAAYLTAMQYADWQLYLPDDILVKVDRASMLNSLEVRAPLLDHELVGFAGTLPPDWVAQKRILKDAVRPLLPAGLLDRPKQGFGVPLRAWFAGGYEAYLRDVLLDPGAKTRDIFRRAAVERLLGRPDAGYKLWTLLMCELWARVYA